MTCAAPALLRRQWPQVLRKPVLPALHAIRYASPSMCALNLDLGSCSFAELLCVCYNAGGTVQQLRLWRAQLVHHVPQVRAVRRGVVPRKNTCPPILQPCQYPHRALSAHDGSRSPNRVREPTIGSIGQHSRKSSEICCHGADSVGYDEVQGWEIRESRAGVAICGVYQRV